jgi:hypothetical protein
MIVVVTAPVVGEQVVENVIDGNHSDKPVSFVDDGHRNEVVTGQYSSDLGR